MVDAQERITVHAATIEHKHGTNLYLGRTHDQLKAQIVGYCRDWWGDICAKRDMPTDEDEIIQSYFEVKGESVQPESLTYFPDEVV